MLRCFVYNLTIKMVMKAAIPLKTAIFRQGTSIANASAPALWPGNNQWS